MAETGNSHKLIVVRNATPDIVDERIASYAEITAGTEGKACTVEVYTDSESGEMVIRFPDDIPYYHFTVLLNALNMPWINNPGAKAAGWASAKEGEPRYMHISTKEESDYLIGINADGTCIVSESGRATELPSVDKPPVDFFEPAFNSEKLEKTSTHTIIVDALEEIDEDEQQTEESTVTEEVNLPPVKKLNMVTIIVIIITVSAALIAALMAAE